MNQEATPCLASTLVLFRRTPAPEIYMVQRSPSASFMPNALVFPGGKLESSDLDPAWTHFVNLSISEANRRLYQSNGNLALGLLIAAVRETFEEVGILLTCDGIHPAPLDRLRTMVNTTEADFISVIKEQELKLELSRLVFWSRWITPAVERRRFDTYFFIAEVTDRHLMPSADGKETQNGRWMSTTQILAEHQLKQTQLAPPTLRAIETLHTLSVDRWIHLNRPNASPICPQLVLASQPPILAMPGDKRYEPPGEENNRFVRVDKHWQSIGKGF